MEIEITHTTQFKCLSSPLLQLKAITSKLSVAMEMAVSVGRQNYTVLCTKTTGKHVRAVSRQQKKIACPHAFSRRCQLRGCHDTEFHDRLCCNMTPDRVSEYQEMQLCRTKNCELNVLFYSLTQQHQGRRSLVYSHFPPNRKGLINNYILNLKQ